MTYKHMPIKTAALALAFLALPLRPALAADAPSRASARLAAVAAQYYEAKARFDPVTATFSGDNRFDGELAITIAPGEVKKRHALYRDVLRKLKAIDRGRLARADATTYDLLEDEVRSALAFEPFQDYLLPISHQDGLPVMLANFAGGQGPQALATVAQYDAYLRRISRLALWNDQAIENMREGMRKGIVQPRAIIETALPQYRALAADGVEANTFYTPIRNLPAGFSEADRARLTAAYRDAIAQKVLPSLKKLAAFLENEYLPACRSTAGWGALPDGAKWYRVWVRDQTTTDLDPDAIHALGLKEVARIQGEFAKVGPKLGYAGPPAGLLAWMRDDDRFRPFRSEEEILAAYRALNTKVIGKLPQLFATVPKAQLEVRPEPELTRASASDHYTPPAPDGSRPGVFWAVINDPAKYRSTFMTTLFLHEGQPGHHFHAGLQQEMALPKFRKFGFINAYGEGWALYAESLGKEMGLYEDPNAYAGHLAAELVRAARLVVDTGLHDKGWSREKAIAYWRETLGSTEEAAKNNIERYMASPGQALGYKIGSLKIQELRERAARALGPKFRLAEFHNAVLSDSNLPLRLLEAKIDRWIAQQVMQ